MPKNLVIIAGPNGAGKSTFAAEFVTIHGYKFLSADLMLSKLRRNAQVKPTLKPDVASCRVFDLKLSKGMI